MTTSGGTAARPAQEDPHPFVSTSLFVDITTITVDPAYVEAAARRAATPDRSPPRPSSVVAVAALLVVGLVCGIAAAQTRLRAPAAQRVRAQLVTEARRRTETVDRLTAREEALRRETAAARDARLRQSAAGRALADQLARLELAVGGVRVRGPGVVVTLDDSADDDDPEGDGRIGDADLQSVVNALWAAGAEAVTVNDRRISALTAIREAGKSILVDYAAVSPPYVVRAVGDPDVLEPAFGDSATARRFRTWVDAFGIGFDVKRAERLDLPAAAQTELRHATPVAGTAAP
ncbi:MAG TPA: DUF881 domain-containing protein [Mycobacteriales bacterium]|nr:DUF881 domain-containing protein [Mycobacteriales bacterium]